MRRGHANTWLLGALALVLVVLGGDWVVRTMLIRPPKAPPPGISPEGPPGWTPRVAALKPAPDFELPDLDGRPRRLSSLRGKPLLLAFYGNNHRSEVLAREFQKIREHVGPNKMDEVAVLCLPKPSGRAFLKKAGDRGVGLVCPPNAGVLERYGVNETPLAWVLDRQLRVTWVMPPVRTDEVPEGHLQQMTDAFRSMIPRPPPNLIPVPDPFADVRGPR